MNKILTYPGAVFAATRALALALLPGLLSPAQAIEEVLTPALYFECQIAARQATVQGLQDRVAQLNKTGVTEAQRRAAGDLARERVSLAMYACGRQDAAMLGAYAHRHADELQTWLNQNPQVRERLDEQARRVTTLSQQMPAVSPSAKR